MSKIFYIMGKSASGKDKIYGRLSSMEELKLKELILYTTRPIRNGETDGRQYYFVNEDKFREFQKEGKVIESRSYQTIHGVWTYFTADDGQMHLENQDYLAIGTLESYLKMKTYCGADRVCPIYIEVEDGERLKRAIKREEKQENPRYQEMCRRFLADEKDFSEEKIEQAEIKIRFQNTDLEHCVKEIAEYIKSEKQDICSVKGV